MPWCPQCDETFPEGPACPRCRAPLMDVGGSPPADDLALPVALPVLKVPRRIRRAFGKVDQPAGPSRQLLAFALSLVLMAGGFALGRMSAIPVDAPVVRNLPGSGLGLPIQGFVDFVGRVPGPGTGITDLALLRVSLRSGLIDSLGRFSSPFGEPSAGREATRIAALGDSIAIALTDVRGRSVVGAFPARRRPVSWLDGAQIAWESPDVLLVRDTGGAVTRWSLGDLISPDAVPGSWTALHQSPDGAVLEAADAEVRSPAAAGPAPGRVLFAAGPDGLRRTIPIPADATTVAVGPGAHRALVLVEGQPYLWDGVRQAPITLDAYDVLGGSFSYDGTHVAMTLRERQPGGDAGTIMLAIVDADGSSAGLRKLADWSGQGACGATPVWNRSKQWVFAAPGDGALYAVEVGGPHVTRAASVQNLGCAIAWSA